MKIRTTVKVKKWRNSMGIIIPKDEVNKMNLKEGQKIVITIEKTENPLKELFGFGKDNPITKEEFLRFRKEFEESKWL